MGLYDGIKDVAKVVQQADNIELYQKLLDLSAQALDMQAKITKLKDENQTLKNELYQKKNVTRHKNAFITLADDEKQIPYCGICYAKNNLLFQLMDYDKDYYQCYECKNYIEKEK